MLILMKNEIVYHIMCLKVLASSKICGMELKMELNKQNTKIAKTFIVS